MNARGDLTQLAVPAGLSTDVGLTLQTRLMSDPRTRHHPKRMRTGRNGS
jgi:hypothetical protein